MRTVTVLENVLKAQWPTGVSSGDYVEVVKLVESLGQTAFVEVPEIGRSAEGSSEVVRGAFLQTVSARPSDGRRGPRRTFRAVQARRNSGENGKAKREPRSETLKDEIIALLTKKPLGGADIAKALKAKQPSVYAAIRALKLPVVSTETNAHGVGRKKSIYGPPASA